MGLIMAMTADSSRGQSGGGQVALDLACWLRDEIPTQSPVVFCGGGRVLGAKPDGEEGCVAGGERGQGYSSASRALDLVEVVRQLLEPQESRSERLRHVLALLDPRFRVHLNVCVCVRARARPRPRPRVRVHASVRAYSGTDSHALRLCCSTGSKYSFTGIHAGVPQSPQQCRGILPVRAVNI